MCRPYDSTITVSTGPARSERNFWIEQQKEQREIRGGQHTPQTRSCSASGGSASAASGILRPMPLDVEARVIQNTRLSPDYNVITLAAPEIAAATKPGQFVMVKARPRERSAAAPAVLGLRDPSRPAAASTGIVASQQTHRRHDAPAVRRASYGDVVSCLGRSAAVRAGVDPPDGSMDGRRRRRASRRSRRWRKRCASAARRRRCSTARGRAAELFYLDCFAARGVRAGAHDRGRAAGERGRVTVPLEQALQSRPTPRRHDLRVRSGADARGRRRRRGALRTAVAGLGRARDGLRPGRLLQLRRAGARTGGGHHFVRSCHQPARSSTAADLVWDALS